MLDHDTDLRSKTTRKAVEYVTAEDPMHSASNLVKKLSKLELSRFGMSRGKVCKMNFTHLKSHWVSHSTESPLTVASADHFSEPLDSQIGSDEWNPS